MIHLFWTIILNTYHYLFYIYLHKFSNCYFFLVILMTFSIFRPNLKKSVDVDVIEKWLDLDLVFILFSTTLHLSCERWRPIVLTPSGNALIYPKYAIQGGSNIIIWSEPSLDDTPRGLFLVQIHCTRVLIWWYIIYILRHSPPMTECTCTYLFYTIVSFSLAVCKRKYINIC